MTDNVVPFLRPAITQPQQNAFVMDGLPFPPGVKEFFAGMIPGELVGATILDGQVLLESVMDGARYVTHMGVFSVLRHG